MRAWSLWLLGLMLMIVEGAALAALGLDDVSLQTPITVALFLGLRRDFAVGALVLTLLYVPMEWLGGLPQGLLSVGALAVFLSGQLLRRRIQRGWGPAQLLVGVVGAALCHLVILILVLLQAPESPSSLALIWSLGPTVLAGGLTYWIVGYGFERLDRAMRPQGSLDIHAS